MAKVTQRAALCAYFDSNEKPDFARDDNAKSSKYIVYRSVSGNPQNVYVGKNGAVRVGKTIAASIPANERFRLAMVKAGTRILES